MRVLLITDGIHPFVMGGMQKHSYYLGKFLSAKGVRVHLVHCTPLPEGKGELDRAEFVGFDARNITFQSVPFPVASKLPGHYIRESRTYSQAVYEAVRQRLGEFDLVYAQGFTGRAFIRAKQRGEHALPVLCNLHGYEMFQQPPSLKDGLFRGPLQRIAKEITAGADGVFSFGGRITELLLRMGVPAERILECPIGIEESWLVPEVPGPVRKERVFIFVGRDERRKGVKELNTAIRSLIAKGDHGFSFHFVGPVATRNRVGDPKVTYHGAVHEERRMQELLRASDVLVCASFSEGMPTVIMEAMASRLAIIGTDVGAIGRQVGDNGWLIGKPVPQAIGDALGKAMRLSPAALDKMKARSLGKVRACFTWERVIERKTALMERFVHPKA